MKMKSKSDLTDVFANAKQNETYLKVCAPMVRYSKVQFRTLVKNYGVDLCFTPMIMADSFCQNEKARVNEFSTTSSDCNLIVQFAANNKDDFVDASKLVYPYADGVDLNCGCPQRWAMKDGYGCSLLTKPELICDLVKGIRRNLPNNFSISVKIRILKELRRTIKLCHQLERCGVNFISVHGRTPTQKSGDQVNTSALKEICDLISIPVIANGGVKTLIDADSLFKETNCGGVMAASGILTNPALFSGENITPLSCVKLWMDLKNEAKHRITFQCYHHHLVFMLDKILSKSEKNHFNSLSTFESVDDYLYFNILNNYKMNIQPTHMLGDFITCNYSEEITQKHSSKCRGCGKSTCYCTCSKYDYNSSDGTYFTSYIKDDDDINLMNCSIFEEY